MPRYPIFCCLVIIFGQLISSIASADEKELESLAGTWVLESMALGGKDQPIDKRKDANRYFKFSNAGFELELSGRNKDVQSGTFKLDPSQKPKHLDLKYKEGELLETRQCIYELNDDNLKIAMTISFAPGTPEQEKAEAKRTSAIRPKDFSTSSDKDLLLVLVLKRQK